MIRKFGFWIFRPRRISLWLIFGFWILTFGFPVKAALDLSEIGVGARPLGMGRAYVGLADDASAIFMNPAGLSQNKNLNIISMGGAMLGDVNYILLGVSDNSPLGKFGAGYVNASVAGIPITTLEGTGVSREVRQIGSTDYGSNLILFSYGSKLSRFLKGGVGGNLSLGTTLKIFSQGFSGGGAPMQDAAGAGMDVDLGFMWEANRWMTWGLTFQNFLPESFGGKFVWQKGSVIEGIPMVTRVGGQFGILGINALWRNVEQKLDLLLDYEKSSSTNRPAVLHVGAEYWPLEMFALRAGVDQKPKATEAGIGVDNNLTAGVGICLAGFTFDYAYHQFGDLSENASHFFSFGYRGEEKVRERERAKIEKRKPTIPLPELVTKPALKTFPDVPEDYWARKPIEYLATLGIMDGYQDGTFRPIKEITHGELAVILARAKGLATKEAKAKFPEKRVTRAEAAQILARFSGLYVKPKIKARAFPDMPPDHWASSAVAATKETGLFAYLAGQGFGPDLFLTRAEAAEIISKTPFVKKQIEKLISGEKE